MTQKHEYLPYVSLHLCRVLDEVGLNELTVTRRRQTYLKEEALSTEHCRALGAEISVYHFGSLTEGATTPGLNSDRDSLVLRHKWKAIKDRSQWRAGRKTEAILLMIQENVPPGYCKLQLLRNDLPLPQEDPPNQHYMLDSCNRVLMKHSIVFERLDRNAQRHGPAMSETNREGLMDDDFVYAVSCESPPDQILAWLRKHRSSNWPSKRTLELATRLGCFLVPVGHRLSPDEKFEWRISTSLIERQLMFSLNVIQIKCYVMLKIIAKTFIEPSVPDSISSFHLKNVVFHAIENSPRDLWREPRLLECILYCLDILVNWVEAGYCPHYVMPEVNLFDGKFARSSKETLETILKVLVKSDGRFLLQISVDFIGEQLQAILHEQPAQNPLLASWSTVFLIGALELTNQLKLSETVKSTLKKYSRLPILDTIKAVSRMINQLCERSRLGEKCKRRITPQRRIIQTFVAFLSTYLGSLMTSCWITWTGTIPKEVLVLFDFGINSDVTTSRLKLASALYCSRNTGKAALVLENLEGDIEADSIQPVCKCYTPLLTPTKNEFFQLLYSTAKYYDGNKLVAHCVRFTRHEIHCVPQALRYEMFRSAGDDFEDGDEEHDSWMNWAVVDAIPYMYYLQYITYRELQRGDMKMHALKSLSRALKEERIHLTHLETDWNLLGHCMELEGELPQAARCYQTSLKIRPRKNAAKWHISMFIFRHRSSCEVLPDFT